MSLKNQELHLRPCKYLFTITALIIYFVQSETFFRNVVLSFIFQLIIGGQMLRVPFQVKNVNMQSIPVFEDLNRFQIRKIIK